ncbi:hypothetical protein ACIQXD_37105 [Streptomyces uncialis]|uniref:hypothetical protein n=1 Tax=Streptomyces uncialis TaxID=1048205 RepID=UPI0037FB4DDE
MVFGESPGVVRGRLPEAGMQPDESFESAKWPIPEAHTSATSASRHVAHGVHGKELITRVAAATAGVIGMFFTVGLSGLLSAGAIVACRLALHEAIDYAIGEITSVVTDRIEAKILAEIEDVFTDRVGVQGRGAALLLPRVVLGWRRTWSSSSTGRRGATTRPGATSTGRTASTRPTAARGAAR